MDFKILSNRKPFVYDLNLESLGLRETSEGYYMAITESNDHTWVLGIEWENNYDPSPRITRLSVPKLERYTSQNMTSVYDIFNFFVEELNANFSFATKVEDDQEGNLEVVLKPSSKDAFKIQAERICEVFKRMSHYGFDAHDRRAGIHININPFNWGNTWEVRIAVFRKFAYFCFANRDIVNKVAKRKRGTQKMSDVQHALGDLMGELSEPILYDRFQRAISTFIKRWQNNEVAEFCNIVANKPGRSCPGVLELRWFASTDQLQVVMSYVEFIEALILFCNNTNELGKLSLEKFVEYVNSYKNKFPNLVLELSEND